MQDLFTIEELDRDGAIQEQVAEIAGDSRANFLRKAAIGGGALLGGSALAGVLPAIAGAATPKSDVAILNFALTLEELEAAFYTEATRKNRFQGKPRQFAQVVGAHERAHVAFLRKALGGAAVKKPRFDFKGTTENSSKFLATAKVLEETGVSAYLGQTPLIKSKGVLAAAGSILTVEARHAAWVRDILGGTGGNNPAPRAFDAPRSKAKILAAVKGTGFIVG